MSFLPGHRFRQAFVPLTLVFTISACGGLGGLSEEDQWHVEALGSMYGQVLAWGCSFDYEAEYGEPGQTHFSWNITVTWAEVKSIAPGGCPVDHGTSDAAHADGWCAEAAEAIEQRFPGGRERFTNSCLSAWEGLHRVSSSATPDCEGTVGEYGCYDFKWCTENWGGVLERAAAEASGDYDPLFDWIAEAVDFVQNELPTRETEMGLRSIQSVVVAARTEGAAAGALEASSRARADCSDSGFFEAMLAFQLRFVG